MDSSKSKILVAIVQKKNYPLYIYKHKPQIRINKEMDGDYSMTDSPPDTKLILFSHHYYAYKNMKNIKFNFLLSNLWE